VRPGVRGLILKYEFSFQGAVHAILAFQPQRSQDSFCMVLKLTYFYIKSVFRVF